MNTTPSLDYSQEIQTNLETFLRSHKAKLAFFVFLGYNNIPKFEEHKAAWNDFKRALDSELDKMFCKDKNVN